MGSIGATGSPRWASVSGIPKTAVAAAAEPLSGKLWGGRSASFCCGSNGFPEGHIFRLRRWIEFPEWTD